MKKIAVRLLCLSLVVFLFACQTEAPKGEASPEEERAETSVSKGDPEEENIVDSTEPPADALKISLGSLDSFSFSLTWDCYGISSYDSQTGKLVKTTDATHPEDYVTTYLLTEEQKERFYGWIEDLQVTDYPDIYDPQNGELMSSPSMTLILTVHTDTIQKTIRASDIALTYKADNEKGRKFLEVCELISDTLMDTEEWKALPEYEFFYE